MARIKVPVDERVIEVFHGTSKIRALEAINTQQLYPSKHSWDWLGNGIYFWERSLLRGIQWARRRWGDDATVVKTSVRLGCCIDLFDTKWVYALSEAHDSLRREFTAKGASLPVNDGESRELDCSLANYLCEKYYEVDTIRAPFFDGEPIFPGSMFYNLTHVQLVVRNSKAIVAPLKLAYGEAPFGERAV